MGSLGWAGFGVRLLFALLLVFATYNPGGYSYFHWVKHTLPSINPYIALAGIALAIGWVIYVRATLRSLGTIGLVLTVAACACIMWLLFDIGVLSIERSDAVGWFVLTVQGIVLAVGMSWSHVRRRMSGQADVDDVAED